MAITGSGQISMSSIRTELGSNVSNFSLSGSQNGIYTPINIASTLRPNNIAPFAMSEWYGYNQSAGDPATSTLTFSSVDASVFTFTLSNPIPSTSFTIVEATAYGYGTILCNGPIIQTAINVSPVSFTANTTVAYGVMDNDFCGFSAYYKRANALVINANGSETSYTNGSTLLIGSTTVTVSINSTSCLAYLC